MQYFTKAISSTVYSFNRLKKVKLDWLFVDIFAYTKKKKRKNNNSKTFSKYEVLDSRCCSRPKQMWLFSLKWPLFLFLFFLKQCQGPFDTPNRYLESMSDQRIIPWSERGDTTIKRLFIYGLSDMFSCWSLLSNKKKKYRLKPYTKVIFFFNFFFSVMYVPAYNIISVNFFCIKSRCLLLFFWFFFFSSDKNSILENLPDFPY